MSGGPIIERVVGGMECKAAKGGWNGGGVALGYRVNRETGCFEVEPAQAPLVPMIFDLYLNKRLGARNVANWLNEHGYRTRTSKPWSFKLLFTVLRNRVYLGQVPWRDGWHPAPTHRCSTSRPSRPCRRSSMSRARTAPSAE